MNTVVGLPCQSKRVLLAPLSTTSQWTDNTQLNKYNVFHWTMLCPVIHTWTQQWLELYANELHCHTAYSHGNSCVVEHKVQLALFPGRVGGERAWDGGYKCGVRHILPDPPLLVSWWYIDDLWPLSLWLLQEESIDERRNEWWAHTLITHVTHTLHITHTSYTNQAQITHTQLRSPL